MAGQASARPRRAPPSRAAEGSFATSSPVTTHNFSARAVDFREVRLGSAPMPHHESGLLALRTTDPAVIDAAAKHYLSRAPHPRVELVRGAGGKGVWLTFGSFVDTDVNAFRNPKVGAALAKALKQPVWVGFAIGGYSNEQTAMAFSPAGKLLWRSVFDFSVPKKLGVELNDPFTGPQRHYELVQALRASNGYGRIGAEFGLDYFRILDVNAGDALFATDKRVLDPKKGAKEHAKWLTSKFVPPEGEPGDEAEPPLLEDAVAYRIMAPVEPGPVAAAVALLLEHRELEASGLTLKASKMKTDTVLTLEGPGVRALSTTLTSSRFVALLGGLLKQGLFAYGWDKGEAPGMRAGQGGGGGPGEMMRFMKAQREPLPMKGRFTAVPLKATAAQRKQVEAVRRAIQREED